MEISEKSYKRSTLIKLNGRIDMESSPELEKYLNKTFKKGQYKLVLDLSGVDYIYSAGLRVLVSSLKTARRYNRGDIRLASLSPRLKEAFKLVGFHQLFQTYDQVEDAVGSF
ncbi:MAG: STAS domain-containing protein [Anaerolineales bacterium]